MSNDHRISLIPDKRSKAAMRILLLTFAVIAEAHPGLPETNGILSLTDAIEFLELCLFHALQDWNQLSTGDCPREAQYLAGEVDFQGLDTDILRAGRHGERRCREHDDRSRKHKRMAKSTRKITGGTEQT